MPRISRRHIRAASGQTLLLGVISLVIILAAILIFFDVQNAIRGKVKGQNAADAAALAGANWQMHSLNLIGELNLVKATTVLISDEALGIAMRPEDFTLVKSEAELPSGELVIQEIQRVEKEKAMMKTALALLDEMQTRVSFVGPLIGFGAAQQAAKNNGINSNYDSGKIFNNTMYRHVWDSSIYGNDAVAPQVIHGYHWLTPYRNMLGSILDISDDRVYGLAACSRFDFLGSPRMTSDGDHPMYRYLTQRRFYDAVNGNNWCELKDFLDASGNLGLETAWWQGGECSLHSSFIGQSEILPLHVSVSSDEDVTARDDAAEVLTLILQRRSGSGMFDTALYFDRQDPYEYKVDEETGTISLRMKEDGTPWRNPEDTEARFSLPPMNWALFDESEWTHYAPEVISGWKRYLSGSFKEGLAYYSGARSYFEVSQSMPTSAGRNRVGASFRDIGGSDALGRRMQSYGKSAANLSSSLATLSVPLTATASAKPIGRLRVSAATSAALGTGTALAPFEAGCLVLPVFTNAALLPVALEPPSGFGMLDVAWFYYLTEFLPILVEQDSLADAWDTAAKRFPGHASYFSPFYAALRKINSPEWRQTGITWLDTPIAYRTLNDGSVEVVRRNRDTCNYWPSGGPGGVRRGPGILH